MKHLILGTASLVKALTGTGHLNDGNRHKMSGHLNSDEDTFVLNVLQGMRDIEQGVLPV